MSKMTRSSCCLVGLVLSFCLASPAAAQLAGVSIQITNVDQGSAPCGSFPSTVNVTAVATVFYGGTAAFTSAWLGESSVFGTVAPAIDWGDGSVVPPLYPTGMPFDTTSTPPGAPGPVRAYRASFSHTYTEVPPPTIRVFSNDYVFSPGYAFTGNTMTAQTPNYSMSGGVVTLLTNTAHVPIAIPACEIDTVSNVGLLILALILAVAGMSLLRR